MDSRTSSQSRGRLSAPRLAVAGVLSAAVVMSAAACTAGQNQNTASTTTGGAGRSSSSSTSSAGSSPSASPGSSASGGSGGSGGDGGSGGGTTTSGAAAGPASCGNGDVRVALGYGTQSTPQQVSGIVFTNVSTHTCTLQGYPGAAVVDQGKVIDAARVLDAFNLIHVSSPPLVTLASGASAYALNGWMLGDGRQPNCYPTGTGTLEVTAPNTTQTVVVSKAMLMGSKAICSEFEISPIVPGHFGT